MPILIITILFLTLTKFIYDRIFIRYDKAARIPPSLAPLAQKGELHPFLSGKNLLTGYHYPVQNARGLILLAPGFRAGGEDYLQLIQKLLAIGWGVFTFDGTGTRRSQGKNQVGFSQCIKDLEESLKYVEKNNCFGYNRLVLMGHSRGAYAACCIQRPNVAAIVSISGINSAMEGIMQLSRKAIGPLCYGNYGLLWLYQVILFGKRLLKRQAAVSLSQKDIPALIIHGTKDRQIPPGRGSIISHKQQITSSRVEYLLCDAGHNDLLHSKIDTLVSPIHQFLLRATDGGPFTGQIERLPWMQS